MKIALLAGGKSAEAQVSLKSGAQVYEALVSLGHDVVQIDPDCTLPQQLIKAKPDIVFNALHGKYGEDGCVQGLLEIMRIPYTHSGVLASALAMDKQRAKQVYQAHNITTVKSVVTDKQNVTPDILPYPYVLKPVDEGSSVGVFLVTNDDEYKQALQNWQYGKIMVEEYVKGIEISIAILNNKALGSVQLDSANKFYDYHAKYTDGVTQHIIPANIPDSVLQEAYKQAEAAHNALGCRCLSRSDFIYDAGRLLGKQVVILETNTHPGMTKLSLLPDIAKNAGIDFTQLIEIIVNNASLDNNA